MSNELLLRRRGLLLKRQEMNIRAVCFKAEGDQTVSITKIGSTPTITMQYSYNGVNWNAWDFTPLPFGGSTKVYIRGIRNTGFGVDDKNYNKITFSTDAFVYVSGIVESLLDGENEVLTLGKNYILGNLFYKQTALRSAKDLGFEAKSTVNNVVGVYSRMFDGCTNLLYAPKVLPLTTLASNCYRFMFSGCTSLVNAPELPATTLSSYCYQNMFRNCSSLVNAPELPATTLTKQCYQNMFYSCTSLKTVRCRAKVTASSAITYWLYGVSPSGTFYGHSEYGWATGVSGIPSGWEFVELTD